MRRNIYILIGVLFLLLIGILYWKYNTRTLDYYTIDYQGAKEMIAKEKVIIIDVRTEGEFKSGHIKGAINVPSTDIELGNLESIPNKKAYYLIYCSSGTRSREAVKRLASFGYKRVYDFGSIKNWEEELIVEK